MLACISVIVSLLCKSMTMPSDAYPSNTSLHHVQSVRSGIEEQGDAFKKSDLEALLNDLRELVALVEGRLPEALDDGNPAAEEPKKKSVLA